MEDDVSDIRSEREEFEKWKRHLKRHSNAKRRSIFVLLALFLFMLGAHNYYVGDFSSFRIKFILNIIGIIMSLVFQNQIEFLIGYWIYCLVIFLMSSYYDIINIQTDCYGRPLI